MALSPEELKSIKEQREATREFAAAAKSLQKVAQMSQENSLRETLGLTKESAIASIQDKLLGNGIKRDIFNFIQDKRKAKALKKSATADGRISEQEYNNAIKRKQQLEKEQATAAAEKKTSDARHAALRATLGDEEANILIEQELLRDKDKIISRDMVLAEQENEAQSLEADTRLKDAAAAKEKADFEAKQIATLSEAANSITESFSLLIEGIEEIVTRPMAAASSDGDLVAGLELVAEQLENSGSLGGGGAVSAAGGGETAAERDAAAAEQENWKSKQLDLLSQIAMSVTKTGGGGSGDGGSGDGGGGMLAKLGAGLGALGKGIGVLLKFAGKGLMIFLKSFAKGIMSFANPLVIAGLAVFTLGMIGLGAALRVAAPAFEALAPVLIKIADVIGNVFMTAIKEIPAILNEIGGIIKIIGAVVIGIIDSIAGGIEKIGQGVGFILDKVAKVIDTIGNKIIGIINSIGASIQGIITSVAEGIATVVESFKGPSLEEKTASIERLSKIDPALMMATAGGIEAIGEALDSIGGGVKIPFLSAESPIAGLIELAKNSKGITDASNAVNAFVENAGLFKDGFEMDDSIISNIEKIVKTLSTGNPQALGALSDVIKSINTIDATKVGLLSQITLPQITPPTADEYERIFKTMQETQPNLIQSISSMFSNAFKRGKVGAAESKLDAISGAADDVTGGKDAVTAAAPSSKSSGKRSLASSERRSLLFKAKRAARDKYGPGSFVSKGTGSNLVFIPASSHPYVLEGKGDPANDSIRASRDSARQSMRASNIAASGGNQSSGQTNVNAPMTNNSRTITTTTNNHSTPHSPSVQSRTAQEFVGFSRGGGNPADF